MRAWIFVPIVALVTAGCHFSPVNPDATVTISGRALDAAGTPLAHTKVQLFKEADLGEAIVGSVLAVGSLGGVCLFAGAPPVCHRGHTATTGADGYYRFTLKGSDTQGLVGNESTLDLVVADPAGGANGPNTTVSFSVASTAVSLPDARLWNAAPAASERSGQLELSWSTAPSSAPSSAPAGTGVSYAAQLLVAGDAAPLWSQPAAGGHARIDARILEDRVAAGAISARTTLRKGVHASYLSARIPLHPISGAPPSRRRPCAAVTGISALATTPQSVCAVTDGDLTAPARLTATSGTGSRVVTGVVVDLGQVRRLGLIVVRGTAGMIEVELSEDGVTYHEVWAGTGATIAVTPPSGPGARYVRVRSTGGLDESLLAEVSAW